VDVLEDTSGITLYADMPAVPRDRLVLRVEGEQLVIEADLVIALPQGM
jgi:HSP20 family protein